jgi:hypothetical protein
VENREVEEAANKKHCSFEEASEVTTIIVIHDHDSTARAEMANETFGTSTYPCRAAREA